MNNNELWFQNPFIIFKNIDQVYPSTKLTYDQKINKFNDIHTFR